VTDLCATRYPHLLAPLSLGGRRLRNRIAHASITTRLSHDRKVTPQLISYYASRAKGGAALIVTEPLSAARRQNLAHKVRVWNDEDRDGLSRWAAAVESEDCRLLGQIQDAGRGRHERGRNPDAIGVSAAPDDLSWTVPHALSIADIWGMIEDFAESSRRLQACGFSGVELSACHGHLFHQFMSPAINTREDEFGGGVEGRLRFMTELLRAIRHACGATFLIGVKMPADDGLARSIDLVAAAELAGRLAATERVDYFCFAQGSHSRRLDMHIPDLNGPRAPYASLTRALRAGLTVPVMAVGLITDPAEADALVANGSADLIGLGRPLITDPAWGLKASQGREAEIRYCVSCNSCWACIVEHRPVACDNNPRVAQPEEVDWWPRPAHTPRRIVVIGAGIAGMEAAWVTAARGHHVTVLTSSGDIGGKTRLLAGLPGGEALSSIYDYQALTAKKAGVHLEFGIRASARDVLELAPDAVVIATGSTMSWPPSFPAQWRESGICSDLRDCVTGLIGLTRPQGGTAVIYDMDATEGTYAAAERLRMLFDRVVIVTPRDRIAEDVPLVTRLGIQRRFASKNIEVVTLAEPAAESRWEEGVLAYRSVFGGEPCYIENVALFTYSSPRIPDDALLKDLAAKVSEVHVIGDAYAPRGTLAATSQGHAIGNVIL
jgi:2,4-dienoyl-CoA reductase-like NADH-dependent reductase (Old Yellow Enzyme family)